MPVTTPPTIDALPEAPLRNQPGATFNNKAAPFVAALDPMGDQIDAMGVWMEGAANQAETWANAAGVSSVSSAASALSASSITSFKGSWSSLAGALNIPATVLHNGAYWVLLTNLANVASSQPSPSSANWAFASGTRWVTVQFGSATLARNSQNSFSVTAAPADITLTPFTTNDFFVVHNNSVSSHLVRIMNPSYSIRGPKGSANSGTNVIVKAGETVHLVAMSTAILEVV